MPAGETAPVLAVAMQQLQSETLMLAIGGLFGASLLLLGLTPHVADPAWPVTAALLLLGLQLAALWLRKRSFAATSVLLVTAALASILLTVIWGDMPPALCLLVIPVGLATMLLGTGWGAGLAGLLTLTLYADAVLGPQVYAAANFLPAGELRAVTIVLVWATVGLLWIALRPLLTAVEWAWSHFEKSQAALEETRDTQVRLKQVLEDLSSANAQLTRLNQLAHGLREAAEGARRAKAEFVANVSHELRTPLNMIIGFTRLIVQTPQVYGKRAIPPALLADLTVILRNSQHLAGLVDDVLDLSQIEADRMALTKERTDIRELVATALTVVRPLFESKHFYLEAEIADDLPPLLVDRTRIREVLLNLLSNAGRFTEAGGVNVRVARTDNDVLFSVADTGPGIAAGDMSKLFQPFQQLDHALNRKHEGTGLGLTLSKRFVELHGGRMWLESSAGEGATFFFTLPLDLPPAVPGGPGRWLTADWSMVARTRPSLAPVADLRPRLVVLDGEGTLGRLLTRYLAEYEILPVPDLPGAAQELAATPAQALLVAGPPTLAAPEQNGSTPPQRDTQQEIQREIQRAVPGDIPVIFCPLPLTGWAAPPSEVCAGEPGASSSHAVADYLLKPISQEGLLAAVTAALRRSGRDPAGQATVLLVDDEPDELRLFWRMLAATGRGFRVLTAANGAEALAVLHEDPPDVIVSDLVMPQMDGFQLAAAKDAVPALRDIPLVILSARDPQGQPIAAESITATRTGGLSIPQLLACVEALSTILSPLPPPPAQRPVS